LRDDSIKAYREALATVEAIRSGSLSADESRTTFLATTKDVYEEASAALAERALLASGGGGKPLSGDALNDAGEAFKIVEQSRARSLLDLLGETGTNITEGVPADLLKRKQDNLDRQQAIAQELTGVSISTDPQAKTNEQLESELSQLQTDYDSIENQIRASSPRYAALTLPQPLSLADVQQQVLDAETALLEYGLGEKDSYLWAVTKEGVSLFRLPARAEVNRLALDLRAQLIPANLRRPIIGINAADSQPQRGLGLSTQAPAGNASPFAAASNALYKVVVEPAATLLTNKRLVVAADGALNYVPFETLVTSASGGDYSALPYLVKSNEIVYAPSASIVAAVRQQAAKPAGRSLLVVADPVFNTSDPRAAGAASKAADAPAETRGLGLQSAVADVAGQPVGANLKPGAGLPLSRLAGTRAEADQISKLSRAAGGQSDVWLDLGANEEAIRTRDLTRYRYLHIATHGLLDAERPQFTGLVLSLVGNKSQDGFLRTDEIFNLKLGAQLVMLSACETGLGKEKRGEGVIGLTRAFMYAGAPTVGVSLWSVADRSTAELMTDFYKRLLTTQGTTPSAALRGAQTSMITGKRYSAPFYWAPFVLVGEWK
ncbi:MAG TPA: CHAT domain-containing protein, partial [Pyrinomonadaceae bacterium]